MHRQHLLALLDAYLERHPDDEPRVEQIADFVRAHADCFLRSCQPGHVTGSAWVVSADRTRVLLVHHRKLDRWLQPGGHADGEPDPLAVALREAREETGLVRLAPLPGEAGRLPLDIDVHPIPARGREPAHLHHDIRFLLVAAPGQVPRASAESTAIAWVERARLADFITEESVLRLERRARPLLAY
jgi:8-oxo-dGTP pyrophosphatase MutT (NUDIX family)